MEVLNLDGEPFKDKATLRDVCFLAATTAVEADRHADTSQKLRLYALAHSVHKGGEVDLTAEDITLLKQRIGLVFPNVIVVGRACEMLENE